VDISGQIAKIENLLYAQNVKSTLGTTKKIQQQIIREKPNMARVQEIQVCGGGITDRLYNACSEYIRQVNNDIDRQKLNFTVVLDNGETKHITFRQMEDGIHVYGDFEFMPNALEWTMRVTGRKVVG
jgi:phosphosulfolactate synthase (CoM biosynthesis protein A)